MLQIFVSDFECASGSIRLRDEKARYLISVRRCKVGDLMSVKDNKGNCFTGSIASVAGREVTIELIGRQTSQAESPLRITLLQGILKGEKMDLVVQKATELGIHRLIPVISERGQVRQTRKVQRWRKIAEEASRQSGRDSIPHVEEAVDMKMIFDHPLLLSRGGIIFWEEGGDDLSSAIEKMRGDDDVALFTGPEGGFSVSEVERAAEHGYLVATLGRRILRAETAALAAISIIQYALGDLGRSS